MHSLSVKDSGKENHFKFLLHHLVGLSVSKPPKSQAFLLWAKSNSDIIQKAWDAETAKKMISPGERAAKLNAFKSKLFKREPEDVQKEWAARAEEDHEEAMKEYIEKMDGPVSKDPSDIQQ